MNNGTFGTVSGYDPDEQVNALLALCRVCGFHYRIEPSTVTDGTFTVEVKALYLPRGFYWNAQNTNRGLIVVGAKDVRGALITAIHSIFCDLSNNLEGSVNSMDRAWDAYFRLNNSGPYGTLCCGEMR